MVSIWLNPSARAFVKWNEKENLFCKETIINHFIALVQNAVCFSTYTAKYYARNLLHVVNIWKDWFDLKSPHGLPGPLSLRAFVTSLWVIDSPIRFFEAFKEKVESHSVGPIEKSKPAGNSAKRAVMDAFFFFMDILLNLGEDLGGLYFSPSWSGIDMLRDYYQELEMRITNAAMDVEVTVLSKEELQKRIDATFQPGTKQHTVLRLYLEVIARDDFQLRYWLGNIDDFKKNPINDKGNLVLVEIDKEKKQFHYPFTVYICTSKTIGEGKTHRPYYTELSDGMSLLLENYSDWMSWDEYGLVEDRYVFGKEKLSQYLIQWMKQMGIQMVKTTADGQTLVTGAGVNYFRKLHRSIAQESNDPAIQADTAKRSGHMALTARKYNAKRKLEEMMNT